MVCLSIIFDIHDSTAIVTISMIDDMLDPSIRKVNMNRRYFSVHTLSFAAWCLAVVDSIKDQDVFTGHTHFMILHFRMTFRKPEVHRCLVVITFSALSFYEAITFPSTPG